MNKQLSALYEKLEFQRQDLLNDVRRAPEKFNLKAADNRWSVHEILAHLVAAEKLSVLYLQKKRLGIESTKNTGATEELKMLLLKISQRLPLKFTAPKPVVTATSTYTDIDELIADWDSTRQKFKELLEQTKEDQLKKKIYKHLMVGRLNIIHAVKFLSEHVNHHLPQINRLLK